MSIAEPVSALLDRFHASRPLRAWSLIVTLYGDAIVPRGGSLWLGSLTEIMDLFGIDAGHVRTACSRLVRDGWLERRRIARNSFYRLSQREQASFAAATKRIYFGIERAFDGRLRVALLGPEVDNRSSVRPLLEQAGLAALSPTVYVGLGEVPSDIAALPGVFLLSADPGPSGSALAAAAFRLGTIAAAYRAFAQNFTPLAEPLGSGKVLDPAGSLVARVLLVHEFRRIVLRDPLLPEPLLPPDWPGTRARALAADIYPLLVPAAEDYLNSHARNENGRLPPPDPSFFRRFGGLGPS
jgi:phenylacetic acid degradation operon negative regulatory protein